MAGNTNTTTSAVVLLEEKIGYPGTNKGQYPEGISLYLNPAPDLSGLQETVKFHPAP